MVKSNPFGCTLTMYLLLQYFWYIAVYFFALQCICGSLESVCICGLLESVCICDLLRSVCICGCHLPSMPPTIGGERGISIFFHSFVFILLSLKSLCQLLTK